MDKKSYILSVFLSLTLMTGCVFGNGQSVEDESTFLDYFPMAVGNHWSYAGHGMEYASFTKDVIYGDGNLFQTTENNGGTVSSTVYLLSDDDIRVVYSMGEDYNMENALDKPANRNDIILKTPLEAGAEWESSGLSYEIVSVDADAETPVGTFNGCIKVRVTHPDSVVFMYYSRGIGMVRTEFVSGDTVITSALDSYDIE